MERRDPILKERLFGLTNAEGNHGEDVKELYYYLDATPSHSYLKMLYKYPQAEFPYARLVEENRRRGADQPEFELLDTGLFDEDRYFDVFVEYAKAGPDDILMLVTVHNRGPEAAKLTLLPQLVFSATPGRGNPTGQSPQTLRRTTAASRSNMCNSVNLRLRIATAKSDTAILRERNQCPPALRPAASERIFQGRVSRICHRRKSSGGESRADRHQGRRRFMN